MVRTGGDLRQVSRLDFVRNVRNVNLIGDAGVAPGIQLAFVVNADAVGVAGGNILHAVCKQRLRHFHHVVGRRQVGQRAVLLGKVKHPDVRADHNEYENRKKHNQTDHRQRTMGKV